MLGAYIYESAGGAEGINEYLLDAAAAFESSWHDWFD